jgi:hypothetical protein
MPKSPAKKRKPKLTTRATSPRKPTGTSAPKLKWSDYEWRGEINLPAWRGFHTKFPPGFPMRSTRPSTGKVKLAISTSDDAKVDPTPAQLRAFDFLVAHQNEIRDTILKALIKAYPKKLAPWLVSGDPLLQVFAHLPKKFTSADDLKRNVHLATIHILAYEKRDMAYVGYACECTWEIEHGLGIAMHGSRILEIGDEETATYSEAVAKQSRAGKVPKKLNLDDLSTAVYDNNLPWVKALLESGADPEFNYGVPGASGIENAVFPDRLRILRELLKYAKRCVSRTAMATAKRKGDPRVLKIVNDHNAKIRRR